LGILFALTFKQKIKKTHDTKSGIQGNSVTATATFQKKLVGALKTVSNDNKHKITAIIKRHILFFMK
jgi:hypothetical protein